MAIAAAFRAWAPVRQRRAAALRCSSARDQHDISTKDWRAQKMMEVAQVLYRDVLSRGNVAGLDAILSDSFVFKDKVWAVERPLVGLRRYKDYASVLRNAYPDLHYDLLSLGVADPSHLFVHFECAGTNLRPMQDSHGVAHKPTFHESHISGVDVLTFNEDRTRITELVSYRQPTSEEREFVEEEALQQHNQLELKLERLHFDRPGS